MNEPKPCPFCGSAGALWTREAHTPLKKTHTEEVGTIRIAREKIYQGHLVECASCGARGPHEYKKPTQNMQEAQDLWNTRHIEDELKVALEATEAERNELETYVSKLVYALTDGKMSKPYDIPVITDAVESIYQEYIREAVAETEAENERLQGMVDWLAHYCASAHAAFQMRYGMEPDERTTVEYWKQGGASLVEEEEKKDENS